MSVVPLTPAQQAAVDRMAAAGDLRATAADEQQARSFLHQARIALDDVPHVTHLENKYNLAYKAAHDVGEAVLRAYGYRSKFGAGAHERIGSFLAAIFDTPPPSEAAAHYEVMRVDRNANHYRARPVTQATADQAAAAAHSLYDAARARIITE
ncbi:MAG: hypothetical protein ACJ74U_08290 [Jatrophihabitantaceae bacterium]